MPVKPVKKKKTKTFTGCATCRSRKIKCDLGKPFCKRCEKSGLICAGYQINLCWSRPVKFDKYGYQLPASNKDGDGNGGSGAEDSNNEKSFQRRNIEFVKYDREYETYEEMDRDLGLLHSPDYGLIEDHRTWFQGPFGVFEGLRNIPSHLMRKRRKLTKTKYRSAESPSAGNNSTNNNNDRTSATESPVMTHKTNGQDDGDNSTNDNNTNNNAAATSIRQSQSNSGSNTVVTGNTPASQAQVNGQPYMQHGNLFEEQNKVNLNNEWLSNELRYDAMLSATAATFNDNFHNFDFMTPFTATETPLPLPNEPINLPELYPYDKEVFNVLRGHPTNATSETESLANGTSTTNVPTQMQKIDEGVELEETDIIISTAESNMPEEIIKIVVLPTQEKIPSSIPLSNNSLQISPLTRYLLNHYIQEVVDLMTVVAFPKNPWRTIYFPRALRAIGDISAFGRTTNSRAALLNALLAVSCFNLQSRHEKGSPETKFFLNLGIELRLQASSFLKKMLESDVPDLKTEKYKDVLVALLSMNTIDIVWGTMADCQYHISMCEDMIERRMAQRPQISHKAKLLHRVFSFLKLVQDSTNHENLNVMSEQLRVKVDNVLFFDNKNNVSSIIATSPGDIEGKDKEGTSNVTEQNNIEDDVSSILSEKTTPHAYSPAFIINEQSSSTSKISKELLLTDALYGVPNSLLLLFNDTVNLLKIRFYLQGRGETKNKKAYIDELCKVFEAKLLSWTNEWKLTDESKSDALNDDSDFLSKSHEGIYHHCMSFYNALIIYYFTMVRDLKHVLLQKYAENVIHHLEALQKLTEAGHASVLPLFWQGFIAGCSSIDPKLQNRYKNWAAFLSKTGVGSYWGARQIMFEVWRRRENNMDNDNWFSVHKDWEMNLMLS